MSGKEIEIIHIDHVLRSLKVKGKEISEQSRGVGIFYGFKWVKKP